METPPDLKSQTWNQLNGFLLSRGVNVSTEVQPSGATPRPLKRDLLKKAIEILDRDRKSALSPQPQALKEPSAPQTVPEHTADVDEEHITPYFQRRQPTTRPETAASQNIFQQSSDRTTAKPRGKRGHSAQKLSASRPAHAGSHLPAYEPVPASEEQSIPEPEIIPSAPATAPPRRKSVGWVDPSLLMDGPGVDDPHSDGSDNFPRLGEKGHQRSRSSPDADSRPIQNGYTSEVIDTDDSAPEDLGDDPTGAPDYDALTVTQLREYLSANDIKYPVRGRKAPLVAQARGCHQAGLMKVPLSAVGAKTASQDAVGLEIDKPIQPRRRNMDSSSTGVTTRLRRSQAKARPAENPIKLEQEQEKKPIPHIRHEQTPQIHQTLEPRAPLPLGLQNGRQEVARPDLNESLAKTINALAFTIILLIVWIGVWLHVSTNGFPSLRTPYCDDGLEKWDNCQECPADANCSQWSFVCNQGFEYYRGSCVISRKVTKLSNNIQRSMTWLLRVRLGERVCGYRDESSIKTGNLVGELVKAQPRWLARVRELSESELALVERRTFSWLCDSQWFVCSETGYVDALQPRLSASCAVWKGLEKHPIYAVFIAATIPFILWLSVLLYVYRRSRAMAESIAQSIKTDLNTIKETFDSDGKRTFLVAIHLRDQYLESFSKKNKIQVWKMVESKLRGDSRVKKFKTKVEGVERDAYEWQGPMSARNTPR